MQFLYYRAYSISNQRKLITDYIENKPEFCLVDEYVDDGYSGSNFERPAWKQLYEDLECGAVNCIVVKDLSRFGRNYIEVGRYLQMIFPVLGVRLVAINDNFDTLNEWSNGDALTVPMKNLINDIKAQKVILEAIRKMAEIAVRMEKLIDEADSLPEQSREVVRLDGQLVQLQEEMDRYVRIKSGLYEDYKAGILSREEYKDYTQMYSTKINSARDAKLMRIYRDEQVKIIKTSDEDKEKGKRQPRYAEGNDAWKKLLIDTETSAIEVVVIYAARTVAPTISELRYVIQNYFVPCGIRFIDVEADFDTESGDVESYLKARNSDFRYTVKHKPHKKYRDRWRKTTWDEEIE